MKHSNYEGGSLCVSVGFYELPDGVEASQIIQKLSHAFAQDAGNRSRKRRLLIEKIEISSMIAHLRDTFDLASAGLTLYEHRELLAGFVAQLSDAVRYISMGRLDQVRAPIRGAVESLAAPVAYDRASHSRVNVVGDNNTVLIIEKADAEAIVAALGNGKERKAREPTVLDKGILENMLGVDSPRPSSRVRIGEAARLASEYVGRPGGTRADASLHFVDGQWFARPAGLGGVMLPVDDSSANLHQLTRGHDYHSDGEIVEEGGRPVRFRVTKHFRP